MNRATLGQGDEAAIWAFRYCLGRMSYSVRDCVDWLVTQWSKIDPEARAIIHRELREAIDRDNRSRDQNPDASSPRPLGMDCDRMEWLRLQAFIVEWLNSSNYPEIPDGSGVFGNSREE